MWEEYDMFDSDGIFMAVKTQQECFMRVCLLTNVPGQTLKHLSLPNCQFDPRKQIKMEILLKVHLVWTITFKHLTLG